MHGPAEPCVAVKDEINSNAPKPCIWQQSSDAFCGIHGYNIIFTHIIEVNKKDYHRVRNNEVHATHPRAHACTCTVHFTNHLRPH